MNYSRFMLHGEYAWSTLSFLNCTHMTVNSMYTQNNSIFVGQSKYMKSVWTPYVSHRQ